MPKKARTDSKGTVVLTIALETAEGERVKGNVVTTYRVGVSTVTAVADKIRAKVFERSDVYSLKE